MDPISITLAAVSASLSLAAFLRALWTSRALSQLERAKRDKTGSKAQIAQLEERVRRAKTLGIRPRKPAPAGGSEVHGEKPESGWNRIEVWGRKNPVALSLIVGCIFLLPPILLTSLSTGEDHGPTAGFTNPEEGASVPYQVRVTGVSDGVPLDSQPWLFVQSNDGDLYPQGGDHGNNVEIDRSDGNWCGYAYSGEDNRNSAGREYSLILALPTPDADRKLQRQMKTRPAGTVPHWSSLPRGFHQLAEARNVIRLPDVQTKAQLEDTAGCH